MKRSPARWGLLTLVGALAACGQNGVPDASPATVMPAPKAEADASKAADITLTPDERLRAGIATETLQVTPQVDALEVTATVRANQDRVARIAPRVEARITTIAARLGDTLRSGQTLATLDSFAIGEAQSALLQAEAALRVAQADFKRIEALNAEDVIALKDFLRARADHERSAAEVRAARDRLQLLGAPAARGRASSTFPVVAPFAGTVIERNAAVGDLASPAQALFTLADLTTVWVEASLPETVLAKIRLGAAATVAVSAYPEKRYVGRVTYLSDVLDKGSRSVAARIEVANPAGRLKPEMFATARIETGAAARPALSVPDAAILLLRGLPTVFVAANGGYDARPVELGAKTDGRTVVTSGVRDGEALVVAGAYALKARLLKSQIGDAQ